MGFADDCDVEEAAGKPIRSSIVLGLNALGKKERAEIVAAIESAAWSDAAIARALGKKVGRRIDGKQIKEFRMGKRAGLLP